MIVWVPSERMGEEAINVPDGKYSELARSVNDGLAEAQAAKALGIEVVGWRFSDEDYHQVESGQCAQHAYLPRALPLSVRECNIGDKSYPITFAQIVWGFSNGCPSTRAFSNNPDGVLEIERSPAWNAAGPDPWFVSNCELGYAADSPYNYSGLDRRVEGGELLSARRFVRTVIQGVGGIENLELRVGFGGELTRTSVSGDRVRILIPSPGDVAFQCNQAANQLVHVGVAFTGNGTVELRSASLSACRP